MSNYEDNAPAPGTHESNAGPGLDTAPEASDAAEQGEKLVPVSEAKRYRKRAQAAETILADLQGELEEKKTEVLEQQQVISDLQHRQQIDELLIEANAMDLETARLLTELAIQEMAEPSIEQAVDELQRRKPFLFRRAAPASGALSPREEGNAPLERRLGLAAAEACATGHRQDLLRYLRLRRRK